MLVGGKEESVAKTKMKAAKGWDVAQHCITGSPKLELRHHKQIIKE